jgi:pimeloyl-ACP methyl ester carboxylesterase
MTKITHRPIIAALLCGIGTACSGDTARAPGQPPFGPGGKEVTHAGLTATLHGSGPQAYWLFEPDKPTPEQAPLIVFMHGWGAMDPRIYQAWIDHIVERGNIVVYPLYQDSLRTMVKDFTPNAIAAVQDAIRTLQNEPEHVKPQLNEFGIVGHSMGGAISANMAALWKTQGLPLPRAIMCVEPGKTWGKPAWATIELADLSQIPADTLLLTVTGDRDHLVRDIDAKRIFNESSHVALTNKNFVTLVSDDHGQPALKATHMAPVAWAQMPDGTRQTNSTAEEPLREKLRQRIAERRGGDDDMPNFNNSDRTLDTLDFYGTWKLFDGLTDAAFYGRNRSYALGNTPEQRFMGVWSDGVRVKELVVTDHP